MCVCHRAVPATSPADITTSVQFDAVSQLSTPSPDPSAGAGVAGAASAAVRLL